MATFMGPVFAVLVTRRIDKLRDNERRRLEVFRALMRTRRVPLNPDHVGALNLIEVEFYRCSKVMAALKELLNHFEAGYGSGKTITELNSANDKSNVLRTALLSAMATVLGYKIEQLEIHRGGYTPMGWGVEWDEQMTARRGLAELLSGKRTLPVTLQPSVTDLVATATSQQANSAFPPKPR